MQSLSDWLCLHAHTPTEQKYSSINTLSIQTTHECKGSDLMRSGHILVCLSEPSWEVPMRWCSGCLRSSGHPEWSTQKELDTFLSWQMPPIPQVRKSLLHTWKKAVAYPSWSHQAKNTEDSRGHRETLFSSFLHSQPFNMTLMPRRDLQIR